ncbi:hypothetical protein BKA64DRAFT_380322 [Cadophora sp. MPI-SDFR-AT-0126]|nr:hypothetical protein BKA64DRAFT_380322 [Leotiomycetes sp. MPI-SDFR-AT-0126]
MDTDISDPKNTADKRKAASTSPERGQSTMGSRSEGNDRKRRLVNDDGSTISAMMADVDELAEDDKSNKPEPVLGELQNDAGHNEHVAADDGDQDSNDDNDDMESDVSTVLEEFEGGISENEHTGSDEEEQDFNDDGRDTDESVSSEITSGMSDFDDDDPESLEIDVEETVMSLSKSPSVQVTLKSYQVEDDDELRSWMQILVATCTREEKEIGRGIGRYVRRGYIRNDFWQTMEQSCEELSSIAFSLFDRYGRLREEYISHPIRKGSGYWGHELDVGDIFIIEDVLINRDHRRKGVGKAIVDSLISKAQNGGRNPKFIIVRSGWLSRDIEQDLKGKSKRSQQDVRARAVDTADAFYRSLGFRRIGGSGCLGLAIDTHHKAYSLLAADDFDPLLPDPMTDSEEIDEEDDFFGTRAKAKAMQRLGERFPLHHTTVTLADEDCVEYFVTFKTPNHMDAWTKVDRLGNNVLHQAALESKPESVRWLLANVDNDKVLSSTRNKKGYTPQEALSNHLERNRNTRQRGLMTAVVSDFFEGFSDDAINCMAALRGIKVQNTVQNLQLKFGCSCGGCTDGFLSARMAFALLCQAEMTHDLLLMDVDDAESWCMDLKHLSEDTGSKMWQKFHDNKDLRLEFSNLCDHVATALRDNKTPTTSNVMDIWKSSSESVHVHSDFHGRATESAIRIIFEYARVQDERAGDSFHMWNFRDDVELLPECRNDHEFGFVALTCGIPNLGQPDHMEWADYEDADMDFAVTSELSDDVHQQQMKQEGSVLT